MRSSKILICTIPLAALLLSPSAYAAVTVAACSNTSVCANQSVCLNATAPISGGVDDIYEWTVERNGNFYYAGTTYNNYSAGGEHAQFVFTNQTFGSGNYRIHVDSYIYDYVSDAYYQFYDVSAPVSVTFSGSATAVSKINGSTSLTPSAYATEPMKLDGSQSSCATQYFVSVMKSNTGWGSAGTEYGRWLTISDYINYGVINNFDIRGFFASYGQTFVPGQYYRIKLAVGNPWNDTTKLVYIPPAAPNFKINGVSPPANGSPMKVCITKIIMDASSTVGESQYSINIQESDPWWNRTYQYEWGHWFPGQAPASIDLQDVSKKYSVPPDFAGLTSRQGTFLIDGNLANGQVRHYRVNLCTNEPTWTCKSALIDVDGTCLKSSTPADELSAENPDEAMWIIDDNDEVHEPDATPIENADEDSSDE